MRNDNILLLRTDTGLEIENSRLGAFIQTTGLDLQHPQRASLEPAGKIPECKAWRKLMLTTSQDAPSNQRQREKNREQYSLFSIIYSLELIPIR